MKTFLTVICLFIVTQFVAGCGSDAQAQINLEIEYSHQSGIQTDVFHQYIEVIDTIDSYNEFWLHVPSINNLPPFDEASETLVVILSPSESCGFSPTVQTVEDQENQVLVTIARVYEESPEACNPAGYPIYGFSWVKFEKSSKLIGVVFDI